MKEKDEDVRQYWRLKSRKYYNATVEYQRDRAECYRYPTSTQKQVDDKWGYLRNMANPRLFSWGAENGFDSSPRKFLSFWKCVERNRKEGDDAVLERRERMRSFHAKKKTRK